MIKNLNTEQKKLLKILLNTKQNLFITGAAGSGKSHVIKLFREIKKLSGDQIPMVASTGAASILVNGVTFNSYFGLGILAGGVKNTIENAVKNRAVCERIIYTDTIIVDEISMISATTFQAANLLCQRVRQSKKFFGGMRVITVGDFLQLGPYSETSNVDWIFQGKDWKSAKMKTIQLKKIMRTKDLKFLDVLAKVRIGKIDAKVKKFLNQHLIKEKFNDPTCPRIYSRNHQVESYNLKKLNELPSKMVSFQTQYAGETNAVKKMKENLVIPEILNLKIGSLVMMRVNNFQDGFVNGTIGTIMGIQPDLLVIKKISGETIYVKRHIFEFLNGGGEIVAKARNFPLILAWAITIQKCQGASIDKALISLDRLWLHGQAYTALSRLSSAQGLHLECWDRSSFIVDKKVLKYYKIRK
jgi:ATP-dependent DNA helicase PIF1